MMHQHLVKSAGFKANDVVKALRQASCRAQSTAPGCCPPPSPPLRSRPSSPHSPLPLPTHPRQYALQPRLPPQLPCFRASAQAFHETEREFLNIAGREGLRDGTTAVCAVIQRGKKEEVLTVAHVGDSRGVLCRAGYAVAITQDHKPDLEPEKARIEALGGFVSFIGCWRAMGILAMSRAIGDLFLKPYGACTPGTLGAWPDRGGRAGVLALGARQATAPAGASAWLGPCLPWSPA